MGRACVRWARTGECRGRRTRALPRYLVTPEPRPPVRLSPAAAATTILTRSQQGSARVEILLSIAIFLAFGFGFVLVNMLVGAIVRPSAPNPEKASVYECGEPTVGSSWVQFDLRFYVVALFYLIFDVEVALIWPIAVVFREHAGPALIIAGVFMALILVGYVYEWYSGSLDWIRSTANTGSPGRIGGLAGARLGTLASAAEARRLARRDPEVVEEERATVGAST